MLKIEVALGAMVFALWVFSLIDLIGSRDAEVRNLPKLWWLLLVLFFPFVGSVAWLVAGRPERTSAARRPHERPTATFPEYDRPGRAAALSPESDEEFLRRCRERAEEQRRHYDEQRRRAADDEAPDGS